MPWLPRWHYVSAQQADHIEDHAVVVITLNQEKWVVDTYNSNFNGLRLDDLLKPQGYQRTDPLSPIAERTIRPSILRFTKINSYPTYALPKKIGN